jgi:hypothetical protein
MSKHSAKLDEFYATSPETAQWLVAELATRYNLAGRTALEPCAGGFVFPDACPELNWSTNDLNQWGSRQPDTVQDFLESEFPSYDYIITNPPFGPNNKLAFAFLEKSTQLADVVAMIVPSSMATLNARLHKVIPLDFKLVFSERCPSQWFELPDGTHRPVRTHGVIWERVPGYIRPTPKKEPPDTRTAYIDFCDDGPFAIRIYGDGVGDIQPWDESCSGTWARFRCLPGKKCVAIKLLMSFPWRSFYGNTGNGRAPWDDSPGVTPSISTSKLLHFVNTLAVLEGRLPPLPDIDYGTFLTNLETKLLEGLTNPRGRL